MFKTQNISSIVFYLFIIVFIFLAFVKNNEGLSAFFLKKTISGSKNIIKLGYNKKEYKVDYTKKFNKTAVEIANFERDEKWSGDYTVDDNNYWEGETSYVISSKNSQKNTVSLQKNIELSGYKIIKMLIYSENIEDTENIKKFILRLGNDDDSAYYEYDIRNVKPGWNIIQISKDKFTFASKFTSVSKTDDNQVYTGDLLLWDKIEKISIELVSLPKSQVKVSIDRLWAERNEEYKMDFNNTNDEIISTKEYRRQSYINIWGLGGKTNLISEITNVKDFVYTAKIIPQKSGAFGINGRTDVDTGFGYYLEMGGVGLGSWQFYKIGKIIDGSEITQLDNGLLSNFKIEANQPIWLRIVTSGNKIAGYVSIDGTDFTKLSEKIDDEIESGGIGTHTTSASFLLESIEFNQ